MKKQPFFLTLTLALAVLTYLVGAPTRVNAGRANISGASEDSASVAGSNFAPQIAPPTVQVAPAVNVVVTGTGDVNVAPEVQNTLNATVCSVLSQSAEPNSPIATIAPVLQGGPNAPEAAANLASSLETSGAASEAVQQLLSSLVGLAGNESASASGVSVCVKSLAANSTIAQKQVSFNVNVNKLNLAINNYNKIVMESSPEALQKLAKNPDFLAIGNLLRQLRAALAKG